MTQPEALRLADELDELDRQFSRNGLCGDAAAELRRLYEQNIELLAKANVAEAGYRAAVQEAKWQTSTNSELNRHMKEKYEFRDQRDALMEFAKYVEAIDPGNPAPLFEKAREAIKKAEGV